MRVPDGEWKDALKKELETSFSPEQLKKAIELVKGAKFVGMHMGDYVFISSDDSQAYLTSPWRQTCTCPASQYNKLCYHMAAADALAVYGKDGAPDAL